MDLKTQSADVLDHSLFFKNTKRIQSKTLKIQKLKFFLENQKNKFSLKFKIYNELLFVQHFPPLLPEFKNTPTNGILFCFKAAKTTNNLIVWIFQIFQSWWAFSNLKRKQQATHCSIGSSSCSKKDEKYEKVELMTDAHSKMLQKKPNRIFFYRFRDQNKKTQLGSCCFLHSYK